MLPFFTRFTKADIPNAPEWISVILDPLNIFCETVVNLLTKNLKIGQNVQGMIYTTTRTASDDEGLFTVIFNYTGGGTPSCVFVGQVNWDINELGPVTIFQVKSWKLNQNVSPARIEVIIQGPVTNQPITITLLVL